MKRMLRKLRSSSIMSRLLLVLLLVLLVQVGINLLVFFGGGIVSETEHSAFSIFSERTANRKLYLEGEMLQRWSNTREGESAVLDAVGRILEDTGLQANQLRADVALCQKVISEATPDLIAMLRRNGVTGAFLVLDSPGADDRYPGVYLRDYDPVNFSQDNTDLLMERGLPAVARENAVTMDSYWSALFHFPESDAAESQFFFTPLAAAKAVEIQNRKSEYFYHWSGHFRLSGMDREVITYSVPLIWKDGTVLGVLGVDLTTDHLAAQLKYDELDSQQMGSYFLGVSQDGGASYDMVCTSGPGFQTYFGSTESLTLEAGVQEGVFELRETSAAEGRTLYGAVEPLKLYNTNTPFVGEQWALIGIMDGSHLLSFPAHMKSVVLFSALASLVLGLLLMLIAARTMTKPLQHLVASLKKSDPDQPIRLQHLNLAEIDALTDAIENLSNAAVESAARSSKIISMTQIPIGTFQYQKGGDRVFCSESLFPLLDWVEGGTGDRYLNQAEFQKQMNRIRHNLYDESERIYRLPQPAGGDRWVQIFRREEGDTVLGAIQDVTRDIESKRKIEYERDFDILTDLNNRRAFDRRLSALFEPAQRGSLGVAALLMFDLDNLKYVNDTYGHDSGDRYIQAFGKSLEFFYRSRSIVGRRSGDEFNVFLYGYGSQDEIRDCIGAFWARAEETTITLPSGEPFKVRASGGLAWYPEHARNCDTLIKKADFAMYNIKHTVKGRLQEFSPQDYEEKAILLDGSDALNRLIDGKLVRYALQPVVSAVDGSVYGYEMLMRPQLEQLADLGQLFRLAKSQSKLWQMERLTWFEALEVFSHLDRTGQVEKHTHAFINSIGSQALAVEEVEELERLHPTLLNRIVLEVTEGEEADTEVTCRKQLYAKRWKAQIALDDFGTGFNRETALLGMAPDLVKVDISIVRGIDTNPDQLYLLNSLIQYAASRNIRVLAEGVETWQELETVITCGVDYVQGYYVAHPEFEIQPIRPAVVEEIVALQAKRVGV